MDQGKPLCRVRWLDHFSDSKWMSEEDIQHFVKGETGRCITVGYLTYEDEHWVVISASFDGDEMYGENIAINKGALVDITPLNSTE